MSRYHTIVTATIANRAIIDGIELVLQEPSYQQVELFHYQKNRLAYRKRTEIAARYYPILDYMG